MAPEDVQAFKFEGDAKEGAPQEENNFCIPGEECFTCGEPIERNSTLYCPACFIREFIGHIGTCAKCGRTNVVLDTDVCYDHCGGFYGEGHVMTLEVEQPRFGEKV